MNTTLITQTLFIESVNIPYRRRREKFARQPRFNGEQYPAPDESTKGNYTSRAELVTSPAIKDGAYDQETIEISTNTVI